MLHLSPRPHNDYTDIESRSCGLQLVDGHSDPSFGNSRPWNRDMSGARGIYVGFRDRVC